MTTTTSTIKSAASKPHYLPTLDGWRALAILGVMLCHDSIHTLGPFNTRWFYMNGGLGVDLFFAISGILICSRLLTEEESQGFISRKNFYIRRTFRIMPPAIFFLATLLLLRTLVHLPVEPPEILSSLFFLRNYTSSFIHFQTTDPYYTSHFWSLAVEEHFYLILPTLLIVTPKKWRVPVLLTIAAAIGLRRTIINAWWLGFHTDMRLDALLIPAAFAVALSSPFATNPVNRALLRPLRSWPLKIAIVLILPITYYLFPRTAGLLIAWFAPLLVLQTTLNPNQWPSRLLESSLLRFIGRLSYSLYLWQQLFLVGHFAADSARLGPLQTWPLNYVMIFACALFSYYVIERPFIKIGHRLAPNVPANQVDPADHSATPNIAIEAAK